MKDQLGVQVIICGQAIKKIKKLKKIKKKRSRKFYYDILT